MCQSTRHILVRKWLKIVHKIQAPLCMYVAKNSAQNNNVLLNLQNTQTVQPYFLPCSERRPFTNSTKVAFLMLFSHRPRGPGALILCMATRKIGPS